MIRTVSRSAFLATALISYSTTAYYSNDVTVEDLIDAVWAFSNWTDMRLMVNSGTS
jgi:hypothetical protein